MGNGHHMIEILLVEDNPGDVRLTREALKDAKVKNTLHVAEDGVEAMDFLKQRGKFKDAQRPGLVLLDLLVGVALLGFMVLQGSYGLWLRLATDCGL